MDNDEPFYAEESRRVLALVDRDLEREPRRPATTLIPKAAGVLQPLVPVKHDQEDEEPAKVVREMPLDGATDVVAWHCEECGKKFRTIAAVERAQSVGCPKCNSGDIQADE